MWEEKTELKEGDDYVGRAPLWAATRSASWWLGAHLATIGARSAVATGCA